MEDVQQLDEVVRPAGRDRAGAHSVFERKVPSDDPGKEFAKRRVCVGISAARERNHRRKFRVAQSGERTPKARQDKGEHERGTRVMRAESRQHEDSGADDGAYAERGELAGAKSALEAVFAGFTGLREQHAHWLLYEEPASRIAGPAHIEFVWP